MEWKRNRMDALLNESTHVVAGHWAATIAQGSLKCDLYAVSGEGFKRDRCRDIRHARTTRTADQQATHS